MACYIRKFISYTMELDVRDHHNNQSIYISLLKPQIRDWISFSLSHEDRDTESWPCSLWDTHENTLKLEAFWRSLANALFHFFYFLLWWWILIIFNLIWISESIQRRYTRWTLTIIFYFTCSLKIKQETVSPLNCTTPYVNMNWMKV